MKKILPNGFTLIELMVVITIIAILSLIGLVAYSEVQKNGRDTKRRIDVNAIGKALETNYTSSSSTPYPAAADTMFSSGKIPTDPQSGSPYTGVPNAVGTSWTVCASLEKGTDNTNSTGNATDSSGAGLGGTKTGKFYCVKSSQ